jgi:predicted PurR-regulated permease PerM
VLAVLSLGALIGASLWVLQPFLGPIIWATMIVVATWPLLLGAQAKLGNRRWLAVTLLSGALLLLLVVPLSLAVAAIVEHADQLIGWGKTLSNLSIPPAPQWLGELPLIGPRAVALWSQVAELRPDDLAAKLTPYATGVAAWLGAQAGNAGLIIMQFLLTVVLAAILYAHGERAAGGVLQFGRRLAGERGEAAVRLAGRAIRGVALGIVVTALVQSVLGGIGLAICGVPFAVILSGVMFILCIAQLGPVLVLAPAVVWLYWTGADLWGTVLLVWTVVVGTLDNLLRPILIRKGADLPLLLIFAGVVGGLIAFGLIGIFVGPVVLAVTYRLLDAWMNEDRVPLEASAAPAAPAPAEPKA